MTQRIPCRQAFPLVSADCWLLASSTLAGLGGRAVGGIVTAVREGMESYEPIRVLGEGAFGKVYLMRQRAQRTLMCVKVIKIKNIPKKEREACRMEVRTTAPRAGSRP